MKTSEHLLKSRIGPILKSLQESDRTRTKRESDDMNIDATVHVAKRRRLQTLDKFPEGASYIGEGIDFRSGLLKTFHVACWNRQSTLVINLLKTYSVMKQLSTCHVVDIFESAILMEMVPVVQHILHCANDDIINVRDCHGSTPLHLALGEEYLKVPNIQTGGTNTPAGQETIVKLLLQHPKLDINAVDKKGRTALHLTVVHEHFSLMNLLLEHPRINVWARDSKGGTVLHAAIRRTFVTPTVVQALLTRCPKLVNFQDNSGNTALHLAIMRRRFKVADILLQNSKGCVSLWNRQGDTLLHLVIKHKLNLSNVFLRTLLENANVDVNARDCWGKTALHLLSLYPRKRIVRLLLEHPATNVALKGADGGTALHYAIRERSMDLVRGLLQHPKGGALVNAQDRNGNTPLHVAVLHNSLEAFNLLLQHPSTKVSICDDNGQTVLHHAILCCDIFFEFFQKLVGRLDLDVNAQDRWGETALHRATKYMEEPELLHRLNLLLEHHSDLDIMAVSQTGETALHLAFSQVIKQSIVHRLIQHLKHFPSAKINAQTQNEGSTVLMLAICSQEFKIARLLLDLPNIQVNLTDVCGKAAMHHAVGLNSKALVEDQVEVLGRLNEMGAFVNIQDTKGYTAFHTACEEGHPQIVKVFLEKAPLAVDLSLSNYQGKTAIELTKAAEVVTLVRWIEMIQMRHTIQMVVDSVTPTVSETVELSRCVTGADTSNTAVVKNTPLDWNETAAMALSFVAINLPSSNPVVEASECFCE